MTTVELQKEHFYSLLLLGNAVVLSFTSILVQNLTAKVMIWGVGLVLLAAGYSLQKEAKDIKIELWE